MSRFWFALAVALTALASTPSFSLGAEPSEKVLFDFEQGNLAQGWQANGALEAARVACPEPPKGEGKPAGQALSLKAEEGASLTTRPGQTPADWRPFDTFSFWAYRSAEDAQQQPKASVEVRLVESDGRTRFWRKVDLDHAGWKQIPLELKWFRQGAGRLPRWDKIDRVQFYFRDDAKLTIDGISARASTAGPNLSLADLRSLAFPGVDPAAIKTIEQPHVWLLSNAPDLDIEKLSAHLAKIRDAYVAEWPKLPAPVIPPALIVFATPEEYQAFTPRLAEKLGGQAGPPKSGGFTVHGIATSAWDKQYGTLRPVYAHEYVHSLVERTATLPNLGEWLQEGLATRYQLQFHPQAGVEKIIRAGAGDPNVRLPLVQLANGKAIPFNRYWQAHVLIEMLLSDPKYQPLVPKLLAAFEERGTTDIAPLLGQALPVEDELEADWVKFARQKYAE